jgi:hypothetical protein
MLHCFWPPISHAYDLAYDKGIYVYADRIEIEL